MSAVPERLTRRIHFDLRSPLTPTTRQQLPAKRIAPSATGAGLVSKPGAWSGILAVRIKPHTTEAPIASAPMITSPANIFDLADIPSRLFTLAASWSFCIFERSYSYHSPECNLFLANQTGILKGHNCAKVVRSNFGPMQIPGRRRHLIGMLRMKQQKAGQKLRVPK